MNDTTQLTIQVAKELAARASERARLKGLKVSIAIVNAEGNLMYFERMDGCFVGAIEAAMMKARSANGFQRPTEMFRDGLNNGRPDLLTLGVCAVPGGLPIQLAGAHAGAIGVSGAKPEEDVDCAKASLQAKENA